MKVLTIYTLQWRDYRDDLVRTRRFESIRDMYNFIDDASADGAALLDYSWDTNYVELDIGE